MRGFCCCGSRKRRQRVNLRATEKTHVEAGEETQKRAEAAASSFKSTSNRPSTGSFYFKRIRAEEQCFWK
jgi:hypothetical protein